MRITSRFSRGRTIAFVCTLAMTSAASTLAVAQDARAQTTDAIDSSASLSNDQLDSLVAPIALYPDPLLAQVLAASTYPLEIVQLQQWLGQNAGLKDQALVDAVEKQGWDPSVAALAPLPDVVKLLTSDIKWTTDLGNAFLAQQSDVMDAVQRMRVKAKNKGALTSGEQIKVETESVEGKSVVVIEQANPSVVYVPSYEPSAVYGAAVYPYPSLYYPGVHLAGMALSFGVGVAMGAAWHGGWGWNAGWGAHNQVNINSNNTFNRNASARSGSWQHNPQHRGGAPYGDRASANRFGGTTRGASQAQRQASARQQQGFSRSQGGPRQPAGGGARAGGGGGDRIGNRSVAPSGGGARGGGGGAFGGGSHGGYNGGSAQRSSARGGSSMGARGGGGGGGMSRGGGGRGGGGGRRR